MDVTSLQSLGYVPVGYPPTVRKQVLTAMGSWKNFCELSVNEKRMFSGGNRMEDKGYMFRNEIGPRADHKELFHVSRRELSEFQRRAALSGNGNAPLFIDAVDTLINGIDPLIRTFAQQVEKTYGLRGFADDVMNSKDNWIFRYLHYFGGDTLAHPHADRGGFTLHLFESDEGGECLDFNHHWRAWPVNGERTIIFPGMGLQYRSESVLKALWHRVQPNEQTVYQGRYAMVAFIDFKRGYRYNDARMRVQDFEPGFNYGLRHEEFKELFVPQ